LNALQKWLWSKNPVANAISESGISGAFIISSSAFRTRICR
jgi:hypothetical protein